MAELNLFELAASLWRRWRWGVPDDCHEGVELGTFRAVSCPLFPKFPQEECGVLQSPDVNTPLEKYFHSSTSVPLNDPPKGIVSNGSFEFAPHKKESEDLVKETSEHPADVFVHFSHKSSSSCDIDLDTSQLVESTDLRFLTRYANRFLEGRYKFEEDNTEQAVKLVQEGVVPCLLLNSVVGSEMVDIRALNIPTEERKLSSDDRHQNHILCFNSLAAAHQNHRFLRIDPRELAKGNMKACMELLQTIVDLGTVQMIDVHSFPELRALQGDDEDIFQFLQLLPEDLLLRWVNFTLSQHSTEDADIIHNLGDELRDGSVFLKLQSTIAPFLNNHKEDLNTEDRTSFVLENCEALKVVTSHSVDDLRSGEPHVNAIFLAQLFMSYHGLSLPSDSLEGMEDVDDFDDEGSREERTFRMWMNSLGCETSCRNLFSADFRTGWMLLELLDSLQPNSIDWTKANKPPFKAIVNRIKSVENCDQVIRVAKDALHLSLVGIGGDDIADGKKKPILALVWQLLRYHTLMIMNSALESASPRSVFPIQATEEMGARLNESDVLAWANHMLDISGSCHRIASFKDAELSNSHALLALLKAIEPSAVQEEYITPGISSIEKEMNAKYLLSLSRKLGATIFIVWEDIVDVRPKMMLMLIASFTLLDKQIRKLHRAATKGRSIGRNVHGVA